MKRLKVLTFDHYDASVQKRLGAFGLSVVWVMFKTGRVLVAVK